ncbi:MAG: SMC family ATPase [Blastocatellia bacterium]|nr:SMC family ATPase [Blastocatellia bacterium]
MQITRVEINNIKNHTESEFTFGPGVVAICGPNGSGKTTILESVAWVLFDHLDYKRDDFVKRGAKRGQVAVSFLSNFDQREYVVTRDTGGGYHVYDPTTRTRLIEQKNQVLPWLRQHIGVDPGTDLAALFKTTIGVPQGTFTYDFTLAPSSRKSVFDQVLKVEEYREASENLRDTVRHIEARLSEADKKMAEAEGELKVYDETKREFDDLAGRLQAMAADLENVTAERDRILREVEELNRLQARIGETRSAIERLRVRFDLIHGSLATAREAAEQAREAAKAVAAASRGYHEYLAALKELNELERRRAARDSLRSRVTEIERDLIAAQSYALRSKERLTEAALAREEMQSLAAKVAEQQLIEQKIAGLREGRGELHGLRRSLDALEREIEKLRERYVVLARQIETAEAQRERAAAAASLEAERARLDDEIARQEIALGNYRFKSDHLARLRKDLERMTSERERYARQIEQLDRLAPAASRLAEFEAMQQAETEKLAHLRAGLARDEEMVTALESGGLCPLLSERCLNLQPGESLEGRFRSGLSSRRDEIASLQTALAGLNEEIKQARAFAVEVSRLPHLESETERLAREIETGSRQIAQIEEEVRAGESVSDVFISSLKMRRSEIENELRLAHSAERLIGQAEVLRAELGEVTRAGEAKKAELDEMFRRISRLGDIEAQLSEAEGSLTALGDPRGRANALAQSVAREQEWREEAGKAELRVEELDRSLEEVVAGLHAYLSLDADIAAFNQQRARSERDYQSYIANEKIAATVDSRAAEAASLSSELDETERILAALAEELEAFEQRYDADRHARRETEAQGLRERATQIAAQLVHTEEQYRRLSLQLARLDEMRKRLCELTAEREKEQRLREAADFIRDILQKAAPYITESYLFSVSNEANQLYREITGRYDVTLHWTKDYEITLEEEGRERPFLNLSGGEQMAAALAVRMALLKELSEIDLAFFDEPTTNMDEERRRNLAQQIGRIKDFQQLFVISHDDSFEEFTDQTVTL